MRFILPIWILLLHMTCAWGLLITDGTTSHYDASGTLLGSTSVEFDANGRRSASIDEEGKRTTYGYDAAGRLTTVSRMINGTLKLQGSYAYDTTGRQVSQTDALGRTTTYAYDNMGRRTSRTLPEGQSESATYDTEGKPATRTDFNGDTTTYAYDPLQGWLLSETPGGSHSSATGVSYTYDASGRRTSMTDASGTTLWTYDTLGRLASVTQFADTPAETTLHYSYEGQGNLLTGMQSSHAAAGGDGAQVAYTYDTLGRLQSASNGLYEPPLTTSYGYDAVGNLATVTHNSGVTATYTYDGRNRLADLHVTHGATGTLATFGYTRDRVGNTTRLAEQIRSATGSAISRTVNYSYDDLHRLTSEVLGGSEETGTVAYTLDDVGNRLGRTSSVAGITPQSLSYSANDWLNSHQYDANGNTLRSDLTSGSVARDAYDFKNRLSQRRIYDASGTVLQKIIDLRYDGDGSLKWKRVTDTTTGEETIRYFVVDHHNLTGYSQIVEELDATGAVVATYHYGHDLISQSRLVVDPASGSSEWVDRIFVYDGGGSVRALTELEGNVTDTFNYDSFGNLLQPSSLFLPTSYLYRGERWDADLGHYYLRARFYDANLGRFHTLDEYEGRTGEPLSLHKYLYAHGNPVSGWDPSGRSLAGVMTAISITSTLAGIAIPTIRSGGDPEVFWDSVYSSIPIFGNIYSAYGNFKAGNYVSGSFDVALLVADIFTAKAASILKAKRFKKMLPGKPGHITGGSARILGANLGSPPGIGYQAHHLLPSGVVKKSPMMKRIGIELDHFSNGIWLPESKHKGFHKWYSDAVAKGLNNISSRNVPDSVREELVMKLQYRLRAVLDEGLPLFYGGGSGGSQMIYDLVMDGL